MPGAIDVVIDQGQMARLTRTLRNVPGGLRRVVPAAINTTATQARTASARAIRSASGIKVGDVRKRIRIVRATRAKWAARLDLSAKRLPLIQFVARQTQKGVTYRMGGTSRSRLPHGFIAVMASGHRGVFQRAMEGGKRVPRLPIKEQWGVSVAGVYEKAPQVAQKVTGETFRLLRRNLESKVAWVMRTA